MKPATATTVTMVSLLEAEKRRWIRGEELRGCQYGCGRKVDGGAYLDGSFEGKGELVVGVMRRDVATRRDRKKERKGIAERVLSPISWDWLKRGICWMMRFEIRNQII